MLGDKNGVSYEKRRQKGTKIKSDGFQAWKLNIPKASNNQPSNSGVFQHFPILLGVTSVQVTGFVTCNASNKMKLLTCYLDLGGPAGSAGQHLELFCLVHGVVSACHHQPVSRLPRAHIIHQIQDCAVHVGVNSYCELRLHWKPKMQGWRIQSILSEKACSIFFRLPTPLLGVPPKIMIFSC